MKRIFFCLSAVLVASAVSAQVSENIPAQLKQNVEKLQSRQPEKLFLHTDRSFYASGDTVWFNAYLLNPATNRPHPVAEILYLDLISEAKGSILSQRLQTENGTKAGRLVLPDSLKPGNYLLQVYTNFQRNAGPQAFFRQPVWINKVPLLPEKTVGNAAEKVTQLQFYPEGGKLLPGLETKVAFKATTANGAWQAVEGKVTDANGKLVTRFRSNDAGFGSFVFKPEAGQKYSAQLLNGTSATAFPLPALEKGYGLRLKKSADSVTILLANSENTTAPVYLVLQAGGKLLAADSVLFNANSFRKRTFVAGNFPEGLVQVSVLNARFLPETERLFFHRNAKPPQVTLKTAKPAYGRRENVAVTLDLKDAAGNPLEGQFSVAVTAGKQVPAASLREYMLLASPSDQPSEFASLQPEEVDNLVLTSSLPGSSWESLADPGQQAPAFARETELNQPGLILENETPVANAVIYLLETNSGKTHLLTSDVEGKFRLPTEGSRFFYQIWQNGIWRQQARLTLVNKDNLLATNMPELTAATDSAATQRMRLRRQIERVYQQEAAQPKAQFVNKDMWPVYAANNYYPLAEYNQLNTMEEILREMVSSVRVVTRKKLVQANVYNADTRTFYPNQPLYIIDGQPTWNNDLFLRLDASQLEQVNVYNSAKTLQPFGFMGNNGVIVVFTKSRNYQHPDLRSENILKVTGQQAYSPFAAKDRPANIPDFRPTLYWNPALKTNNGQAAFSFKTSNETGNLRVQVEGITSDGRLISEELLIPVQPAK